MDELKFRYAYRHNKTKEIIFKYFTIEDIENGDTDQKFQMIENYELIGRDLFTGLSDRNDKEIYASDKFRFSNGDEHIVYYYLDGFWALIRLDNVLRVGEVVGTRYEDIVVGVRYDNVVKAKSQDLGSVYEPTPHCPNCGHLIKK